MELEKIYNIEQIPDDILPIIDYIFPIEENVKKRLQKT